MLAILLHICYLVFCLQGLLLRDIIPSDCADAIKEILRFVPEKGVDSSLESSSLLKMLDDALKIKKESLSHSRTACLWIMVSLL